MSFGARPRAVLASLGTLGLVLAAATSPASAADGAPTAPTQLFNGYRHCSTDANRPSYQSTREGLVVEGIPGVTDATGNPRVGVRYQSWPVTDPTRITTVTRDRVPPGFEAPATLPASALDEGRTYAWRAQTVAGGAASDWSAPCYVTPDKTAPAAPTVTSPNYRPDEDGWNKGGEPVEFTLGASGVDDVEGFEFSWQQDMPVIGTSIGDHGVPRPVDPYSDTAYFKRADALGGSAGLSLVPPGGSGVHTLWVRSLDRAHNRSAIAGYTFRVSSTTPTVTPAVPKPEFGEPTGFTLRPAPELQAKSPVVSYSVRTGGLQNDRTFEVAAGADGTATVDLALDGIYGGNLQVTSKSANGWVSDQAWWSIDYDTTPTVASNAYPENRSRGGAGVPGTFTFTPKVKDVVSYTYTFHNGAPEVTVPADADHTATIDWTPASDGWHDLTVYATTRSGIQLAPYDYFFTVG
ncbi:hypothetical protein AB0G60_29530 [Streptomyces angustmyceticus]|uniref:Large secreted protein n=1 Tax=Streptomyces angustmyceticus TaxID=285578 RepID=A0A5J4LCH0_9ACTN|nr:hypothetical protein [Streptomyces angustmyceticus]UAL69408.1 hypothetical protein K7396_25125 [Streptomyces angustmyceticus]GES29289.1 hypothetical protein San01_17760 [Streptomyces angustmyceticus]